MIEQLDSIYSAVHKVVVTPMIKHPFQKYNAYKRLVTTYDKVKKQLKDLK